MGKINYPKINKNIQDYIYEEEGNISRDKVLFIGSMLVILAAMIPSKAFAGHRSHSSHASHSSHTSSAAPAGHASHESHASSSVGAVDSSSVSSGSASSASGTSGSRSTQSSSNAASASNSSNAPVVETETVTQTPGMPQIPDPTPKL